MKKRILLGLLTAAVLLAAAVLLWPRPQDRVPGKGSPKDIIALFPEENGYWQQRRDGSLEWVEGDRTQAVTTLGGPAVGENGLFYFTEGRTLYRWDPAGDAPAPLRKLPHKAAEVLAVREGLLYYRQKDGHICRTGLTEGKAEQLSAQTGERLLDVSAGGCLLAGKDGGLWQVAPDGSRTLIAPEYEDVDAALFCLDKIYYTARRQLFCSDPADGAPTALNRYDIHGLGRWRDGMLLMVHDHRTTAREHVPMVLYVNEDGMISGYGKMDEQFLHAQGGRIVVTSSDTRFCVLQTHPQAVFTYDLTAPHS